MKSTLRLATLTAVPIIVLALICSVPLFAQDQVAQQSTTTTSVPNLIRYGGVLKDANGAVLPSQTLGVTFSIYKEAEGGVSLWHETRNVVTDISGQYNVLLGSTMSEGVPVELFADQEQRWLSVQVQDQPEQARVLLVSVPYAFKAHEAETLGGLPASAFMKAPTAEATGSTSSQAALAANAVGSAALVGGSAKATGSSGNSKTPCPPGTNHIMYWDASNDICPSVITQDPGNGNLGVGLPSNVPASEPLDVFGVISTYKWYDINENRILSVGNSGQANNASTNLFIGWNTGTVNNSDTSNNTFSGRDAGASNTNGHDNTFSGYQAGNANTGGNSDVGSFNTFTGSSAGLLNSTGFLNTFTGYTAGFGNQNGYQNSCFGSAACLHNLTGIQNVSVGAGAGFRNTNGSANVYIGFDSGWGNTGVAPRGSNNTMTGWQTGFDNFGSNNVFYGYQAGFSNTTGNSNIAVGALAGSAAGPNQSNNIYIGHPGQVESGPAIRIGVQGNPHLNQTYIGGIVTNPMDGSFVVVGADGHLGIAKPFSGTLVTGGCSLGPNYLTKWTSAGAVGCTHVWENPSAPYRVGIGTTSPVQQLDVRGEINVGDPVVPTYQHYRIINKVVLSIDGTNNVFTGEGAGTASGSTTGNTFTGYNAGNVNTADGNSFYGYQSGAANTTGIQNVFAGYQAGVANDTGYSNIFIGYKAGQANTTESYSTFVGTVAGFNSTVGGNTFLGYSAGSNTTVGYGNVATGYDAGRSNQDGILNAYYGVNAGFNGSLNTYTHGSYNTFLGNGAGSSGGLVNGSNNIFLGFAAGNAENDVSNSIEIGNNGANLYGNGSIQIGTLGSQVNKTYMQGIFTNLTPNVNTFVTVQADGHLGQNTVTIGSGNVVGPPTPCAANFLTKWAGGLTTDCSVVFQQPGTNNIGINNTNPSEALDVTGVINASQWYDIAPGQLPVLTIGANIDPNEGTLLVGVGAGPSQISKGNTFIGAQSGFGVNSVGGGFDTFVGYQAAFNQTDGQQNAYFGAQAGYGNSGVSNTGSNNAFFGQAAGFNNAGGEENTFLGRLAGASNESGGGNIYIGDQAGTHSAHKAGDLNVFIGYHGGQDASSGSNDIYLSNFGAAESNTIRIGNVSGGQLPKHTDAYIAGIYNSAVGATNAEVCIDSDGKLGTLGCPASLPAVQKQQAVLDSQQNQLQTLQSVVVAQQQEIQTLKSQLQLQNAAFQERLSRLESALSTQVAVADKTTRPASSPNGGMQ